MMALLYLTLLLATSSLMANPGAVRAQASGALMRAEMRLLEARARGDLAALSAVYADGVIVVADGVVRGRAESLAEVGKRHEYSVVISNPTVRVWGDVGLVVGRFSARSAGSGVQAQSTGRFVDVWLETANGWRLVCEQLARDQSKQGGRDP